MRKTSVYPAVASATVVYRRYGSTTDVVRLNREVQPLCFHECNALQAASRRPYRQLAQPIVISFPNRIVNSTVNHIGQPSVHVLESHHYEPSAIAHLVTNVDGYYRYHLGLHALPTARVR